jgi:hypothetical protein
MWLSLLLIRFLDGELKKICSIVDVMGMTNILFGFLSLDCSVFWLLSYVYKVACISSSNWHPSLTTSILGEFMFVVLK